MTDSSSSNDSLEELKTVEEYLGNVFLQKIIAHHGVNWKMTQKTARILKGVLDQVAKDMRRKVFRKDFKLGHILVNNEQVKISVKAKKRTSKKCYDEVLKNVIELIHQFCSYQADRIPEDLEHLMQFLNDYKTFRRNRKFVLNHPCFWPPSKADKEICYIRREIKGKPDLMKKTRQACKSCNGWKNKVKSILHSNLSFLPSSGRVYFRYAAQKVFDYKMRSVSGDGYGNGGIGFLFYVRNLLEHGRDYLTGVRTWAPYVIDFMCVLYPIFLSDVVLSLYEDLEL